MTIVSASLLVGLLTLLPILLPAQEKAAPPPLALSMRDAIRLALSPQGNLGIGVAAESERAAEARLRESRAALLPEIDTSISGQNQVLNLSALGFESVRLPVSGFSFPKSVGPFNTVDARVRVRQSLLDWASIRRSRATRAGIETAKDETDEVRDRVAAQVAKLYLAAVRAATAVEVAQATVAWADSSLQEVSNRNASGKALGVDVSRARVRLATEKEHLLEVQMERSRAGLDLLSDVNLDLDTPLQLADQLAFTPQEQLAPEQAVAIALKSRSEILAQRQRVEAARLRDVSIGSERLPSLSGYADVGTLGTTVANSIGTYTVGVSLRIPVFDGGRTHSRREETQALIRQEKLRASQLEKQIALEVRQALIKLEMTRGEVDISAEQAELAQQEIAHLRRRYEEGIEGRMELAEAQLNLARTIDHRTAAIYAWNVARIQLMQAMGTVRTLTQ